MYKIRLKSYDLDRAREVLAIIEKDYQKHYSYADLQQLVGSNAQTLKLAFKSITGKSVYEYLTQLRVEKAKHLLETSDLTIETIARKVGLDRSNLNKQFKKLTRLSLAKWRADIQKNADTVNNGH